MFLLDTSKFFCYCILHMDFDIYTFSVGSKQCVTFDPTATLHSLTAQLTRWVWTRYIEQHLAQIQFRLILLYGAPDPQIHGASDANLISDWSCIQYMVRQMIFWASINQLCSFRTLDKYCCGLSSPDVTGDAGRSGPESVDMWVVTHRKPLTDVWLLCMIYCISLRTMCLPNK